MFNLTPTVRGEIIEEIANAGLDTTELARGKKSKLSSTQADDLTQAQLALFNIQRISGLFEDIGKTDPIIGRFREKNPYDNKIVELNSLITQTVPGLARGIFKEVGVLTDTDIARYTDTIANPKLTADQVKLVTDNLLETIEESIRIQINTLSSLGYDLGTFEDTLSFDDSSINDGLSDEDAYQVYLNLVNQTTTNSGI